MVEDSFDEVPEWDVMFTQNQHEIPLDPIDVEEFELHDDFLTKEEMIVVQNDNHKIFAINSQGEEMWSLQIESKILGRIS